MPIQFLFVELVNCWPIKPIVHIEPINLKLIDYFKGLGKEKIPRLLLSVVQNSCVVVTY